MRAWSSSPPTTTVWIAAGLVGQPHLGRLVGDEARAEALGLVAHARHELGAHDPLGEARVVLDVGRLLEQAAPEEALDDERLEVGRAVYSAAV